MTTLVHSNPLISIRDTATVREAAQLMGDCSIGAVGVLGAAHEFVGILTERDLTAFVAQARDANATRVSDVVNDFPVVVDGPLEDWAALERMRRAHIRHLIVREGKEVRIVSMRDYLLSEPAAANGRGT